jgi:hypothetical protein
MGEPQVLFRKGMAIALGNISSAERVSDTEDEPRHDSGKRALSGWDKAEIRNFFSRALEKVAKEVGVEHASAGMSSCALLLSY